MTIALTILSLAIAAYRIRKGLFTRVEWFVLALWLGHFALEEAQLFVKFHHFRYDPRYFRPVSFLSWIWLAWGLSNWWTKVRWFALSALAAALVFDATMIVKPNLPFGRRGAYVRACDWAVERIRADWKGPVRDATNEFSLAEYHSPYRPIVMAHVARLPYLLNGRYPFLDTFRSDNPPDYWTIDVRRDDPPPASLYELMDSYQTGKFKFNLYRCRKGPAGR